MRLPIDVATRVSRELSDVMERMTGDPDREEPPTLADVRAEAMRHASNAARLDERLHPQQRASMLDEIDELIDEFGDEAPAIDFVSAKASEPLSRIVEAVIADARVRRKATLAMVRDAMTAGLIARLVGDGAIEPDDDASLVDEIDGLIERHGRDALAEEFVRYE